MVRRVFRACCLRFANRLKAHFENGTILISNDNSLKAAFRVIRRAAGTGDKIRLVYDGTGAVYADEFWALTLAYAVAGLTPARLIHLLLAADAGQVRSFLTLAGEMEERDLHYASALATRKRRVKCLGPTVELAGKTHQDQPGRL